LWLPWSKRSPAITIFPSPSRRIAFAEPPLVVDVESSVVTPPFTPKVRSSAPLGRETGERDMAQADSGYKDPFLALKRDGGRVVRR
jgi:hypothetical protein